MLTLGFTCIKKWSIVPGPIHQNKSILSQVMLPNKDRTVSAWSFNLRRDKFVMPWRDAILTEVMREKFRHEALIVK